MRATVYHAPGDVRVETVADPQVREPTDAVVRITRAAVCGSDLWFWRGINRAWEPGWRCGHEFVGVVEEVGAAVSQVRRGDAVIAPFAWADGDCEFCRAGVHTSCVRGGYFGGSDGDGGQGEAARVPFADATLVRIPDEIAGDSDRLIGAVLLTDVMPTGHHAAVRAGVGPGSVVAVVGDGAVGLCAVHACRRLGADRVIALGHHQDRLDLARRLGATDAVDSAAPDCAERVLEMTGGGCPSVCEAVGNQSSMELAIAVCRPGGTVGFVGVPRGIDRGIDPGRIFGENLTLAGGVAPVRAYLEPLLADYAAGVIDPRPVVDRVVSLDDVAEGYRAMDDRAAIKVMVRVAD